ncbi:hypothetical protein [Paenibacillus planticolens]|uniref:Uncharacterized protein n=1 Tax=Paenibacillus planticolens TaxID=2654976 RepID=A0ABX1ZVI1_9BACL|nr:hypothetical protein [Paenibacillus planticolens]NOV03703.1 hypothetical protein [Paenibacillus planticolens]
MKNKVWWKLYTYAPFLAALLVIGMIHTLMLANEEAKPYPEPFGRATELPQLATSGESVQLVGESSFSYRSGQALQYVRIDETGQSSSETRPLPDPGLNFSYRLIQEDGTVWIGADKKLYASEWTNGSWSPKKLLIENDITDVQTVNGSNGIRVLLAYNEEELYVGAYQAQERIEWSKVEIGGIKRIQGVLDSTGSLSLVYTMSSEGNVAIHFAKLEPESWKPIVRSKLKELNLVTSKLDDVALGLDGSSLITIYTTSSPKTGKSSLYSLTFPVNHPEEAQDELLNIPVSAGIDSDTILHPAFTKSTSGEVSLVVSSVYEKNRRLTSQEVYKLAFKEGKLASSARISQFGGFAEYPVLVSDKGNTLAIWLDPVNPESFRIFYATDQLPYQEKMNKLSAVDLRKAAETLPLLWGIGLLTSLLGLKWIVLPGMYLLALSAFWQYHYDARPRLHFGLSFGLYIVVKALFIGDYRKAAALQVMPDFLQPVWVHLMLLIAFAVLAYVSTRIWRNGLDDRNVGLEMFYFALLDGFITNLWYSYFMSPASL